MATGTSAYGIDIQATAFQGPATSNHEEMLLHLLFRPGLEVLLCATLGPQPSSEGSMSGVLQTRVVGTDGLLTLSNASSYLIRWGFTGTKQNRLENPSVYLTALQ